MASLKYTIAFVLIALTTACGGPAANQNTAISTPAERTPVPKPELADHFAYPLSEKETITAKKDKDSWWKEVAFGQDDSLGEHWTFNSGWNTACGEPVYAIANGVITYAKFSGPEWGLVMIVDHELASGERVQSLYGNVFEILVESGPVKKRQQIARVGNANGRYLCRLHLEMRTPECPFWGQPGPMNSKDNTGFLDPSNFINAHR